MDGRSSDQLVGKVSSRLKVLRVQGLCHDRATIQNYLYLASLTRCVKGKEG